MPSQVQQEEYLAPHGDEEDDYETEITDDGEGEWVDLNECEEWVLEP
jgi:hypothetical protein